MYMVHVYMIHVYMVHVYMVHVYMIHLYMIHVYMIQYHSLCLLPGRFAWDHRFVILLSSSWAWCVMPGVTSGIGLVLLIRHGMPGVQCPK